MVHLPAAFWARKKGGSPEVTQADRELARACVAEGGTLEAALAEAFARINPGGVGALSGPRKAAGLPAGVGEAEAGGG